MLEGTAAGKYASQLLKAGCAAQPGGCSARFVPAGVQALVVSDDGGRMSHFLLSAVVWALGWVGKRRGNIGGACCCPVFGGRAGVWVQGWGCERWDGVALWWVVQKMVFSCTTAPPRK